MPENVSDLQNNFLWGTMEHEEAHNGLNIIATNGVYHETGAIFNSLLRYNFLNLYYVSLKVGCILHWTPQNNLKRDGRIVYGIDLEL
jgi:hypothetical protein